MTCIVGLLDKGKVYIGGDCAGAIGYNVRMRKDPKVFKKGEFLIGYTSSFRMGQLLRFNLNIPALKEGQDIYEYMVTEFTESVRGCLKQGGYTLISNNEEFGGTFLVGFRGRLFCIEDDFQVGEVYDDYDSVGCGANYSLGSLYATEDSDMEPEKRVEIALKAAEKFNGGVSGPFTILTI